MQWFALTCGLSGSVMGWFFLPASAILVSSSQWCLFVFALWLSGELDSLQSFGWAFAGLVLHQVGYLAGLLVRAALDTRVTQSSDNFETAVEKDLDLLQEVSQQIAREAPPNLVSQTRNLSRVTSSLRHTLIRERRLKALLKARRFLTV